MRHLPVVIGIAAMAAYAAQPLPVCEEFNGEEHIQCVSGENSAVIISNFADGSRQYEFYTADGGKGYVYIGGGVYASTAKRHLEVAEVPAKDAEAYVQAVIDAVADDIGWN